MHSIPIICTSSNIQIHFSTTAPDIHAPRFRLSDSYLPKARGSLFNHLSSMSLATTGWSCGTYIIVTFMYCQRHALATHGTKDAGLPCAQHRRWP